MYFALPDNRLAPYRIVPAQRRHNFEVRVLLDLSLTSSNPERK